MKERRDEDAMSKWIKDKLRNILSLKKFDSTIKGHTH